MGVQLRLLLILGLLIMAIGLNGCQTKYSGDSGHQNSEIKKETSPQGWEPVK